MFAIGLHGTTHDQRMLLRLNSPTNLFIYSQNLYPSLNVLYMTYIPQCYGSHNVHFAFACSTNAPSYEESFFRAPIQCLYSTLVYDSTNIFSVTPFYNHPIILTRFPPTLFPCFDLNMYKCQIPSDLTTCTLDQQQIALFRSTNIRHMDIDTDTAVLETIRRSGSNDDASDPIDNGCRSGAMEDGFAVHENF